MKIKQHFILSVYDRKYSRTYGGSNYTLSLYENLGKGNLKQIGFSPSEHCTRSHKGEVSEGYSDLIKLGLIKSSILKAIAKAEANREKPNYGGNYNEYYHSDYTEKFGLKIDLI